MIFFYNAQGNVINVVPEPVYQGSNKANTIYVVAPFPSNVQVLAHFLLPNGEILQPAYAPNKNGLTLLDTLNINDSSVGVWGVQLTKVITAYAGTVSVQFEFISYDQEITTKTVTFPVSKGVPPSVPLDMTAETTLQEILAYVSMFYETLDTISGEIPLVANETFVLDVAHESIVVGYNALLPLSSFNKTPVQGDKFWGICKTNDNYAYSFVATVTSVDNENSVVEVEFTKVVLLYDADFHINVTNKLNKLIFDGNGDKFLSNDGEYKKIVGGGTTVTVDGEAVETFNADIKLDKVNIAFRLYGTGDGGNQTTYAVGWSANNNVVPIYDRSNLGGYNSEGGVISSVTGAIKTAIPEKPDHATPKKWVEGLADTKLNKYFADTSKNTNLFRVFTNTYRNNTFTTGELLVDYWNSATAYNIPVRNRNNLIYLPGHPIDGTDSANKSYVDDKVKEYQHQIEITATYEGQVVENNFMTISLPSSEVITLTNIFTKLKGVSMLGVSGGYLVARYVVNETNVGYEVYDGQTSQSGTLLGNNSVEWSITDIVVELQGE